ncbi:glyoxalase [Modestobacter muralis]|uniref:Glyoxalase n=2 Tax=Modestobacter muralis TaxID=1608614 RepID=A0A6P0H8T3_9ACTN|nr:glyoxalase [Modestobacter muralis]NEN52191.1 glyoxalase [Modestobacter muralis]
MPMLFVTLPVQDLPASRAFYEALGFSVNQHSSDEHTAAVVLDDNIVVRLLVRDAFADLVAGDVADPAHHPTVVHSLTVPDRADVDELVAKAVAAGSRPGVPAPEDASTHTGSFTDPDGHAWQALWMDQLHVVN